MYLFAMVIRSITVSRDHRASCTEKRVERLGSASAGDLLSELPGLFASREITPELLLERQLDLIARDNPRLNIFVDVDGDTARPAAAESSRRWRSGRQLSAVDGATIAVKSNIAVAGLPRAGGLRAYGDCIAQADAACVAHLRAAGAVIIGTTNMHEAAFGATTDNPWSGRTHNPRRHGYTPGGSSGGSAAAVAAGQCVVALGTDTLGSVRIPASYCGNFGHKPVRLIPHDGVMPLAPSFDEVGVHARSAADCRVLMELFGGTCKGSVLSGARLAWLDVTDFQVEHVDDQVAASIEQLRARNASVAIVRIEHVELLDIFRTMLMITKIEAAEVHHDRLLSCPEGFSAGLRTMLEWGGRQSAARAEQLRHELATLAGTIGRRLAAYDALLTPTTSHGAFAFGTPIPAGQAIFTVLASCLKQSATAFPIGLNAAGLPLSFQVMSPSDSLCLNIAEMLAVAV